MKKSQPINDWIKPRGYLHFTYKLNTKKIESIKSIHSYVSNPENIKSHGFYPLIYKSLVARRYKIIGKDKNGKSIRAHSKLDNKNKKEGNAKIRHIFYASHMDSHIYSYYTSKILTPLYNNLLNGIPGLSDCVSAYRKIPTGINDKNKNNIHFAKDVFDFIKAKGDCTALCFDVSSFFDTLNHKYLKKQWCKLLDSSSLPDDHYNIFKSLTDFSYVKFNDIMREYNFSSYYQLKKQDLLTFCSTPQEFISRIKQKGYIMPHKFTHKVNDQTKKRGIPQGTSISAFLSNLYLFEFDKTLFELSKNAGGYYRRYSDDILMICPSDVASIVKSTVLNEIQNKCFLEINEEKVECYTFKFVNDQLKSDIPLKYLGFEFDGKEARIKSASIAKYYRNLKKGVRSQAKKARHCLHKKPDTKHGMMYKRRLYKNFSHLGKKSSKRNFYVYAKEASEIMGSKAILCQMAKSWKILNSTIKKYELSYNLNVLT